MSFSGNILQPIKKLKLKYNFNYRRWIRLLFGREFPLDKVLILWDGIFAEDPSLKIVDFVCVAMMLLIRDECKYYYFSYRIGFILQIYLLI
jgi:hypothetical protein